MGLNWYAEPVHVRVGNGDPLLSSFKFSARCAIRVTLLTQSDSKTMWCSISSLQLFERPERMVQPGSRMAASLVQFMLALMLCIVASSNTWIGLGGRREAWQCMLGEPTKLLETSGLFTCCALTTGEVGE